LRQFDIDFKKRNESPLDLINKALSLTSLTYRLKINASKSESSLRFYNSKEHLPILFDEENKVEKINFHDLSSGEKVLMSLALKLYVDNQSKEKVKLILLDEPDAFLHPSMLMDFYKIVYDFFIKERDVRVILTTHKPTTIALAPENDDCEIFELSKPTTIKPISKEYAVENLCEGLITVSKLTKIVLLEGKDDKPFYESIYQKLIREKKIAAQPSLVFAKGKSKDIVKHFVKELNENQNNFLGIIDRDQDELLKQTGVFQLKRYSIENYLLDPIVSFFTAKKSFGGFKELQIKRDQVAEVSKMDTQNLQKIADLVFAKIKQEKGWKTGRVEVEFVNGHKLNYPEWFFCERGKDLLPKFQNALSTPSSFNRDYLTTNLLISRMIPLDLLEMFNKLIES